MSIPPSRAILNKEITLRLKGDIEKRVPAGTPFFEVVKMLGQTKDTVGVLVNGLEKDLSATAEADAELELLTFDSAEGLEIYRHTSAHVMAQAVKEIFPSAKITIGPVI